MSLSLISGLASITFRLARQLGLIGPQDSPALTVAVTASFGCSCGKAAVAALILVSRGNDEFALVACFFAHELLHLVGLDARQK